MPRPTKFETVKALQQAYFDKRNVGGRSIIIVTAARNYGTVSFESLPYYLLRARQIMGVAIDFEKAIPPELRKHFYNSYIQVNRDGTGFERIENRPVLADTGVQSVLKWQRVVAIHQARLTQQRLLQHFGSRVIPVYFYRHDKYPKIRSGSLTPLKGKNVVMEQIPIRRIIDSARTNCGFHDSLPEYKDIVLFW